LRRGGRRSPHQRQEPQSPGEKEAFRDALRGIRDRKNDLEVTGKPSFCFQEEDDATTSRFAPYDASPVALYDENAEDVEKKAKEDDWGKITWTRDMEVRLCSRQECGPTW